MAPMAVAVEQETERLEKRGSSGREEGEMGRRGAGLGVEVAGGVGHRSDAGSRGRGKGLGQRSRCSWTRGGAEDRAPWAALVGGSRGSRGERRLGGRIRQIPRKGETSWRNQWVAALGGLDGLRLGLGVDLYIAIRILGRGQSVPPIVIE